MAVRTSDEQVRAVIETDPDIGIEAFIRPATALTDYVESEDSDSVLGSALLTQIETFLAAHFYARRDPQYRSKITGRAEAQFQGKSGMRLDSTDWGQDAIVLDVTGCLASLNTGRRAASIDWLGKAPSDQILYEDRD